MWDPCFCFSWACEQSLEICPVSFYNFSFLIFQFNNNNNFIILNKFFYGVKYNFTIR